MEKRERACAVYEILDKTYPHACCSLNYGTVFELLVATILAAQCTDERVNIVTESLFERYKTLEDYALCPLEEMEEAVRPTGFFRNKAKNIILSAQKIISDFGGEVPKTMEELLTLPGVGRKTANLILGDVYGVPSVVVDTHVKRITGKIGLTENREPEKIEADLRDILPEKYYTHFNHLVVFHGREICKAKNPLCEACPISHLCDYFAEKQKY